MHRLGWCSHLDLYQWTRKTNVPEMKLSDAAEYIKTGKAITGFLSVIRSVYRVFTFTYERSNRIARYVVIVRAYKKGVMVNDIQEKYGCSRQTILRYARLAGLPKRPKHFPLQTKEAVIQDWKNGMRLRDISRKHGVSEAYISKTMKELGLSRYKPKWS